MNKEILKVPSEISRVQTMADGGLRLYVDTQELNGEDKGLIMGLHKKIGWFVFSETQINREDILDLPDVKLDKGQKSESQRQRAVLFLIWEKKGKNGSFDTFYKNYMDRHIDKLKEELN